MSRTKKQAKEQNTSAKLEQALDAVTNGSEETDVIDERKIGELLQKSQEEKFNHCQALYQKFIQELDEKGFTLHVVRQEVNGIMGQMQIVVGLKT